MKIQLITLALAAILLQSIDGAHWALLVAGSSGYYNYRHQADVCHSYQILHKHGIPDENIIVMMYDDIANSRNNPTPGIIINKPDGLDVYKGVPKDYTGKDVTPENFLKILQGKDMTGIGSGKTLKSTKDDNVFVYFADHGAPNIIAFPRGELHAKDLQEAILAMNATKTYKNMVFYIEACESGSMFNKHKLPKDIDIYATTAANNKESSYACYWDKKRKTYLGDVYSVKWLEDSDTADFSKETLFEQFTLVKKETNTSHVQEFGNITLGKVSVLGQFQGMLDTNSVDLSSNRRKNETKAVPRVQITDAVPSHDVIVHTLKRRIEDTEDEYERASLIYQLEMEHDARAKVVKTATSIVRQIYSSDRKVTRILSSHANVDRPHCYKKAVTHFRNKCYDFTEVEYALRYVYVLANLCDQDLQTDLIIRAIDSVC